MFKKILIFLSILFISISLGVILFFNWQIKSPFDPKNVSSKIFQVKKDEGVKEIAKNLKKADLIRKAFYFETYIYLAKKEKELKTGEYHLSPSMNISEITNLLVKGVKKEEIKITIPEGWNSLQIAEYLEEKEIVSKEKFLNKITNLSFDENQLQIANYQFLKDKPKKASLEGYLFPDTYFVYKKSEPEKIIKKMLDNFEKKFDSEMRKEIEKQEKTIFQIITMASLIEKEAKTNEERRLVSGIFWKRIEKGLPLQSCATINYLLNSNKRILSQEDLKIESPYNTYKYKGLPPGPISNPGLSSILAAIYPQASDYWYFLSTDQGETIFSRTAEEHSQNKEKYLKPNNN